MSRRSVRGRGRNDYYEYESQWPEYVPVGERRAKASRETDKLRKSGKNVQPVIIEGRTIAHSVWGKAWLKHLESFSDYANRLPRGRSYVRHGSVCHLEIKPGRVEALVSGSSMYKIAIDIAKLNGVAWGALKAKCAGQIGSMIDLLRGKLSAQVMAIVTDRAEGLFPQPGEIKFDCSCPDWADMCKHVAATLYGVGARLDREPELLFVLRGVEAEELIAAAPATLTAAGDATPAGDADRLSDDSLGAIFGDDIEIAAGPVEGIGGFESGETKAKKRKATPKPRVTRTDPNRAKKKTARKKTAKKKTTRTKTARPKTAKKPLEKSPASDDFVPTGQSIAALRKALGLAVPQFAKRLGVTPATVYRWESASGRLKLQSRPLVALTELARRSVGKNGKA